jgi:hypothetical protein
MAAAALGFLLLLTLFASGSGRRVAAAQRRSFIVGRGSRGAAARVFEFVGYWANEWAFMCYGMEICGMLFRFAGLGLGSFGLNSGNCNNCNLKWMEPFFSLFFYGSHFFPVPREM